MSKYLYRAQIVEQPEWEERECFRTSTFIEYDEHGNEHEREVTHTFISHVPVGWEPDEEYIKRFSTDDFIEPSTDKFYRSRSSAKARVDLLEAYGYKAVVQRSAPVEWPAFGEPHVDRSEWARVKRAVRELVDLGVIKSADEIL